MRGRTVGWLVMTVLAAATIGAVALPNAAAQDDGERTVVRVALNGYENNITPFTVAFGALPNTHDLMHLVYDALFWSQAREDPEPWLAEGAEPSDDFRTWTVRLRDGITWHDGEPFTAEDVKFSFDYYIDTFVSGRYAHHAFDVPKLDRAVVVDDRTLRLHFESPAPQFEIMPGADLPIVPKHIWEDVDDPRQATEREFSVGTGPYRVADIAPDQRYRLVANERYFKGAPLVDELVMPIVQDPTAAFQALRAGQVDTVTENVPPELVDRFEGADGVEVVEGTRFESTQLYFNAQKEPLDDPALRKAISLAIDNEALVERILQGDGEPGHDNFIHPESPWAMPEGGHEHDPARAEQMLEEAGYRAGDGDVRRSPDGEQLEFSILVSSFEPEQLRAAQLIADQVAEIGVRLVPESLDPAALRQRREPEEEGGVPPYDMYMSGLETHAHVDPDALYYFFHSPGEKGFGNVITGYANREFDRLVERAATMTPEERKPLLHEAQQILAEEVPVATLWYRQGVYAYRPAAYDRWTADLGHGIFHKRSFLEPYAGEAGDDDGEGGSSAALPILIAALAISIPLGALMLMRRRRRRRHGDEDEEVGV